MFLYIVENETSLIPKEQLVGVVGLYTYVKVVLYKDVISFLVCEAVTVLLSTLNTLAFPENVSA